MISDKIKIMMLKGEKGDEYDDTELRAEINAKLANTPYIGYTEDGTFELPIHTINDSVTGNTSTWSSNKIAQKVTKVVYDIDIENFDGEVSTYYTTATANATYTEVLEMISNNVFKPEAYTHYETSSEYGHKLPTSYDFIDMSGTSSPSFVRIVTTWNNYKVTIVHDANDNINVTFNENEDYSGEIADLQSKQVDVVTVGAESEIKLGTNGGFISLFKQVPSSASVPAGTIADAFIIGLPTDKYPPSSPLGNVYVFATKLSGSVPVYIDAVNVKLHNDQYYVTLTLRNTSNETLSYEGLTDVMLVNMN